MIPEWQSKGYEIKLFFLKLPDPDFAIARVRQRVREGGHDVPEDVIRRRFHKGLHNFGKMYRIIVDEWAIYDNAGKTPVLVDEGGKK